MGEQKNNKILEIKAPISGKAVPLSEVPDPVFSEKMMGDGLAIIPDEGKIYSPVNGEIIMVSTTKHAYGILADDGTELLIHFGLETVELNGEGFNVLVKSGDKVKVGDIISEVDYEKLKAKNINMITPVLICNGSDEQKIDCTYGNVEKGKDVIIKVEKINENVENTVEEKTEEKENKKFKIDFDFLQKLGKVLMTVIAVMPAAGLMISLGKLVQMAGADMSFMLTVGSTMENIG